MSVIDTSKRRLLADQVMQLHARGELGLPLGCDFNWYRGERWTDRLTGKEHLRLFPSLLNEPDLGFAPQTVLLLDSIMSNLGQEAGAQFVLDFTRDNTNTGTGYWHHRGMTMRSKTNKMVEWICTNEKFGALGHMIFGKEPVQGVADALKDDRKLHGRLRTLLLRCRRLGDAIQNREYGRPNFDPCANWSVTDTPLRELLPQLGSLKGPLFDLAEGLCLNQEHADTWAQHRFKHPLYWTRGLAREGDQIQQSVVPNVLGYASESLATTAVFLGLYAAAIQGNGNAQVQRREGYILADALNCLARAHALRVCAQLQQQEGNQEMGFDLLASKHFQDAYIEAYKAIGEQFVKVLSTTY